MDAKEIERLKKLVALFDSANAGERTNAIDAAGSLLKRHGKSMVDLPAILGQGAAVSSDSSVVNAIWRAMYEDECRLRRSAQREVEIWRAEFQTECRRRQTIEQERDRIAKQQKAAAQAERDRWEAEEEQAYKTQEATNAKDRKAVIKRFGSVAAVLVPCEREKLLKAAVRQWSKFYTAGEPEWTTSICRCCTFDTILGRKKSLTHVIDAIAAAFPLPETIEGAVAEKAYWDRRVRETALVRNDWYYAAGDLTIQIRQHVLQGLIDTMPARTVQDVLARVQGRDMTPELQKAVIADLKALSAATETVVSHEEFRAARQRRAAPVKQQPKRQPDKQGSFGF